MTRENRDIPQAILIEGGKVKEDCGDTSIALDQWNQGGLKCWRKDHPKGDTEREKSEREKRTQAMMETRGREEEQRLTFVLSFQLSSRDAETQREQRELGDIVDEEETCVSPLFVCGHSEREAKTEVDKRGYGASKALSRSAGERFQKKTPKRWLPHRVTTQALQHDK
jgi:hypothetical protein